MHIKSPTPICRSAILIPAVGMVLGLLPPVFSTGNAWAAETQEAGASGEKDRPLRILQMRGLHFQHYRVEEAAQILQAEPVAAVYANLKPYKDDQREFPGFPASLKEMIRFHVIVMNDLPAHPRPVAQLTPARLKLLCDYVASGGALLIFGGHNAFAGGGYREGALAEILPVKFKERFDVAWLKPPAEIVPADGFLQAVNWRKRPVVVWLHRFEQAREGATIFARAGNEPAIIGREWGKGRVAVVAATCLGLPPDGRIGFWDWPEWPQTVAEIIQWLTKDQVPGSKVERR